MYRGRNHLCYTIFVNLKVNETEENKEEKGQNNRGGTCTFSLIYRDVIQTNTDFVEMCIRLNNCCYCSDITRADDNYCIVEINTICIVDQCMNLVHEESADQQSLYSSSATKLSTDATQLWHL